jgi:hypothetical protein
MGTKSINLKTFYNNLKKNPLRYKHQFVIEMHGIENLAASNIKLGGTDANECITYWGKSTDIPEAEITEAKVDFFGNGFVVPGVVKYPETWKVTLILDQDFTMYSAIKEWSNYCSDLSKSGAGTKTIPNVRGVVRLLNEKMNEFTDTFVIEGIWPQEVSEISFSYKEGASEIKTFDVTFAMQYFYREKEAAGTPGTSDPLNG